MHSSRLSFASDIVEQARKYTKAIDLSVVAAQKAYTVAGEVLTLAEVIPLSTPEEHQRYLVGMVEYAKDGHDAVNRTLETFRGVRADILAVSRLFFFCHALVLTR
jgi:hypothetical protein